MRLMKLEYFRINVLFHNAVLLITISKMYKYVLFFIFSDLKTFYFFEIQ